ncbi:MAG: hypothetical protein AAGK66_02315 [Pseudomonadota bacterium]
MPKYEPNKWNKPGVQQSNNCYNYATNQRNEPKPNKPLPKTATPGNSAGIEPGLNQQFVLQTPSGILIGNYWTFTCKSIKIGCVSDGLSDPNADGNCAETCWKVAYYNLPPKPKSRPPVTGDFHFVRQDSDGKWSHKPGKNIVTRYKYNPKTKRYDKDAGEITDPEKDNVGDGYEFCGYLCCCPDVEVAMSEPPERPDDQAYASITPADSPSSIPTHLLVLEPGQMDSLIGQIASKIGTGWTDGFWEGDLVATVAYTPNTNRDEDQLLVYKDGFTLWRGFAQSLPDPDGLAASIFSTKSLNEGGLGAFKDFEQDSLIKREE